MTYGEVPESKIFVKGNSFFFLLIKFKSKPDLHNLITLITFMVIIIITSHMVIITYTLTSVPSNDY